MHKFFKDKRVTEYLQNKSIFEICSLKEDNSSRLLAWLLNPNEYHGLGNKFALHILKKFKKIKVYNNKGELCTDFKISDNLFKNAFVTTEYTVQQNKNVKGRIDVLAIDLENNICLVIENKYGSFEHDQQCKKYMQSLDKLAKNNSELKFIYVFLDLLGNTSACDAYNNLDYEDILTFKNAKDNELVSRIFESWELDINGKEDDEKTIKELADEYGAVLEGFDFDSTIDDYFRSGTKEGLYASTYGDIIGEILNFYKHQSKVYEVRYSEEFKNFIENNKLEFWEDDYRRKGVLNFSYNWACNENDNDKWAVYGCIYKEKGKYEFTIQYYAPREDVLHKKLESVLKGKEQTSEECGSSKNVEELFDKEYVEKFKEYMEEARKMIEK